MMLYMFRSMPMITSVLWVIPFSMFQMIDDCPFLLLLLILIMTIFSCLFWIDPIANQNTLIHTLDAACARITIVSFIAYNLIFQIENVRFFISMGIMFVFFYASNYYSKRDWCCEHHIYSHLCAHIFALFGIYFTFTYLQTLCLSDISENSNLSSYSALDYLIHTSQTVFSHLMRISGISPITHI
jgi:hypothetical protein